MTMRRIYVHLLIGCTLALLAGCNRSVGSTGMVRPAFSSDSAYSYVARQVSFGPRVPGTESHEACAQWLVSSLERMGASVEWQRGTMTDYQGQEVPVKNIIAHLGSRSMNNRILLAAHYDTRPWSDEEVDYEQRFVPIDGANDGASGVGVLLEVARRLGQLQQDTTMALPGVDIVLFDVEDMGTPDFYTGAQKANTWCLGSQFWASLRPIRPERYSFGIVLDMVGAPDAVFPMEAYSMQYADGYVQKIWRTAAELGYGSLFARKKAYPVVDDHYYVNTMAGIPCVDVIHYNARSDQGFPFWWHTREDGMQHVSATTLQAVGEVVLAVVGGK